MSLKYRYKAPLKYLTMCMASLENSLLFSMDLYVCVVIPLELVLMVNFNEKVSKERRLSFRQSSLTSPLTAILCFSTHE